MLPKINCLKKKKDFEQVFKKGKGFKEDFLILKYISSNLRESRFGIIVSQKVSKKATTRNKIKRRLRALISFKLPKIKKSIDAVLVVLPGFENKDFWEAEEIINKLFEKAKLV
jgi:ribonuclease P protein component